MVNKSKELREMQLIQNTKSSTETLAEAFKARDFFVNYRSSAIFPVFIRKSTDVHIVFLNYWMVKNQMEAADLTIIFSVYKSDGSMAQQFVYPTLGFHNQVSIRNILNIGPLDTNAEFDGIVNVEILSTENLRFAYPGIIAVYQSGSLFSSVHSAGRIKNPNEKQLISYSNETNWNCKFKSGIEPFFHYFVGPSVPQARELTVILRSQTGVGKEFVKVDTSDTPSFGSKFVWIKEIFPDHNFETGDFVSVLIEHNSVFPRLVVGNLHTENNFLEVTHSFPIIEEDDYCTNTSEVEFQSMLCAFTSKDLELSLRVFPTNCSNNFSESMYTQKFNQKMLQNSQELSSLETVDEQTSSNLILNAETKFICIRFKGDKVPSRINTSFVYKVRNQSSNYSTDIADGAESRDVPLKSRQWGHGYLGDGYKSLILLRNNKLNLPVATQNHGVITVFGYDLHLRKEISIDPESALVISINELIEESGNLSRSSNENPFISWFLEVDEPIGNTFWLAYRTADGAIFGDHGF
jgi:hypothetical protein